MIKKLMSLAIFAVLILSAWMLYFASSPLTIKADNTELELKSGSSLRSVGQQLVAQGVLSEPWSFVLLVRLLGGAGEIKAGNYMIEPKVTPYELYIIFTRGNTTQASITFIEGWNFNQMREALNKSEVIRHKTMAYADQQILAELGASENIAEGLFFPDTYYFSRGASDLDVLKRAYQTMQNKLTTAWQARDGDSPYQNPYQALIMASIVEKETGKAAERPEIAGVFINRLRIGMRLQTDPTVIYGMGNRFDGNLRKRDLLTDTPYNTYTRAGLPPTPIAMPSLAAIEATLHPAKTKALYFVGKGDGSHAFSASLAEHNRAVARYQLRGNNAR